MKTQGILCYALLISSLLISGCASSPGRGLAPTYRGAGKAVTVKGLHLGMDLDDAKKQVAKLFDRAGIHLEPMTDLTFIRPAYTSVKVVGGDAGKELMVLKANSKRRLSYFSFRPDAMDLLLGTGGMDNDAIARKVIAEYRLPQLKRDSRGKWEVKQFEGVKIKLHIVVSMRYFTVGGDVD